MLNIIEVRNYKCLRNIKVHLEPFTVFIGPNDSGKSSLLACLSRIGRLALDKPQPNMPVHGKELLENANQNEPVSPVEIFVSTKPPQQITYLISVTPEGVVRQRLTVDGSVLDIGGQLNGSSPMVAFPQGAFNTKTQQLNSQLSLLTQFVRQNPDEEFQRLMLNAQQQMRVSERYQLSPAKMRENSPAVLEPQLIHDGSNLASVMNSILTSGDLDVVNPIMQSLNKAIPTIKGVSTPPVNENGASRAIRFILEGKRRPPTSIPSSEASDGVMFFTAFLALAYSQMSNTILIEEPENGLHPERIETVVKLLRQLATGELGYPPRQIILTTHSPLLLNYVEPKEVRIFQRDDQGGTSVTPMHEIPEIDRLQKEYATGELWYMLGEKALLKGPSK